MVSKNPIACHDVPSNLTKQILPGDLTCTNYTSRYQNYTHAIKNYTHTKTAHFVLASFDLNHKYFTQ